MNITQGTARVSATIDISEATEMYCVVSKQSGDIELRLGDEADAYLMLTRSGAEKLVRTLGVAGVSSPARS